MKFSQELIYLQLINNENLFSLFKRNIMIVSQKSKFLSGERVFILDSIHDNFFLGKRIVRIPRTNLFEIATTDTRILKPISCRANANTWRVL